MLKKNVLYNIYIPKYNITDTEISSDESVKEDSDEDSSNEENSDEENHIIIYS